MQGMKHSRFTGSTNSTDRSTNAYAAGSRMTVGFDIGTRAYSPDDQIWFAEISRDFNPMHLDAEFARRTAAGRPIVHGMHLLVVGLELALVCGAVSRVRQLRAKF